MNNNILEQELKWLLENDVSQILDPLESQLTTCLKESFSKISSKLKLTCLSSTGAIDAIRGTVVLHRDTLCSMELFIKPTKAQGSLKASFRSDKQWKLQQVHDSLNHLQKANDLLGIIKQSTCIHSPQGLVHALDEIIKHLRKCQARLVLPSQLSLQALIGSGFTKMFAPPLPGEYLMNVFVIEDRLVVINYTVQQGHINASLNPNKNTKLNSNISTDKSLFHPVGSVLEHGGVRYEVSSANRCETTIPMLTTALQVATDTQLHCQNLKDKLMKLKSCWL